MLAIQTESWRQRFQWFNLTELIIVVLTVLALGAVVLLTLAPLIRKCCETTRREYCARNLKRLGEGLHTYAELHDRTFPDGYPDARTSFAFLNESGVLPDGIVYGCPDARPMRRTAADSNFIYAGGGRSLDDPDAVTLPLAHDVKGNHPATRKWFGLRADKPKWMNALFVDGHVEGAPPDGSKEWNAFSEGIQ